VADARRQKRLESENPFAEERTMEWVIIAVGTILLVVAYVLIHEQLSGIRAASERQADYLERMGRSAGWLPPKPPTK
jgi:hypothetical protein